jgi:uncharacterized protein (TIGR02246 family)
VHDDLGQLAHRTAVLETREAVRDLLARYADAVDRRDLDGLSSIFAPDAVLTSPGRRLVGLDEVIGFYREAFTTDQSPRRHFITNVHVTEAAADSATSTAYLLYTAATAGASIIGWGHYTDTFRRIEGELRVASKEIVIEFRGPVIEGWGHLAQPEPLT